MKETKTTKINNLHNSFIKIQNEKEKAIKIIADLLYESAFNSNNLLDHLNPNDDFQILEYIEEHFNLYFLQQSPEEHLHLFFSEIFHLPDVFELTLKKFREKAETLGFFNLKESLTDILKKGIEQHGAISFDRINLDVEKKDVFLERLIDPNKNYYNKNYYIIFESGLIEGYETMSEIQKRLLETVFEDFNVLKQCIQDFKDNSISIIRF